MAVPEFAMSRRYCLASAAILALAVAATATAPAAAQSVLQTSSQTRQNLVIGTGQGSVGNEFSAFQQSNTEIGANQELVSTSSNGAPSQRTGSLPNGSTPNLFDVFLGTPGALASPGGNRWSDIDPNHGSDTVGIPDRLPGARPIFEGIDFTGNVALTGSRARFESSNSDINANIGVQCNRAAGCFPNPSSPNTWFPGPNTNTPGQNLNAGNGITQFNPTNLINELKAQRDFIVGLQADATFTSGFVNQNIKDAGAPAITDLDAIDASGAVNRPGRNDGFAVIDIDVGADQKFEINNTDWILRSTKSTFAIVRMKNGSQFDLSNASVVLGDGNPNSTSVISSLGAIFFQDAFTGTNELFNLNNVILGGVALWDLADFNPNRNTLLSPALSNFAPPVGDATVINMQNAQGCSQFVSHQVLMSNNRWNRCAMASANTTVTTPAPPALAVFAVALFGLAWARRRRAA
jgi:MYXO-CTERM domain-containing protein